MAKKKIEPQKPVEAAPESRKTLYFPAKPWGGYGKSDRNIKTNIVDVVW